jgi:hypothetical protein
MRPSIRIPSHVKSKDLSRQRAEDGCRYRRLSDDPAANENHGDPTAGDRQGPGRESPLPQRHSEPWNHSNALVNGGGRI